jgi:hypothetical protein
MRWINGYTYEEKIKRGESWHRWFAWFPVVVEITADKREIKEWLCWVEVKGHYSTGWGDDYWWYEYRSLK